MRLRYTVVFAVLIAALLVCTVQGRLSPKKKIRNFVGFLEAALIPPVVGNLLIVASSDRTVALIGHYIYYLGMDLVMYALVLFTNAYCKGMKGVASARTRSQKPTVMYIALAADAVQMFMNLFFRHAFDIEAVNVDGAAYYRIIPLFGQIVHRVVDYAVFLCVLLMFLIASATEPKLYRERYTMILLPMALIGLFQTYFIFSKSPIDRSMIGYGVFGLIIYYFSIVYRPLRLLDRMLSNIVSDLPDSFYIFDPGGKCLWANIEGCRLVGEYDGDYDVISARLHRMFGDTPVPADSTAHSMKRTVGEGEETRYYELEESQVQDDKGHLTGSYLRIQDITEAERDRRRRDAQIGQISQEAYRDALTGVGNKAAYNKAVAALNEEISRGLCRFAVVMVDMNNLKQINDEHGHRAGDAYIKGCCHLICEMFKRSPVFRIGGDEFAVILKEQDYENRAGLVERLRDAYEQAVEDMSVEPWERYSAAVGIAEHASDDNSYELVFKRADAAMYDEKKAFKIKHGSYR